MDATIIFEEFNKEPEQYLLQKSTNIDSTDSVFDFLEALANRVQEDFDEIIAEDTDRKRFIKALTLIFALLLNTNVDTEDKLKKILKIAAKATLKI